MVYPTAYMPSFPTREIVMQDWIELLVWLVSGGYLANIVFSGGAYLPQLLQLFRIYQAGERDNGLSLLTYLVWSCGAGFTTLYGLVVAQKAAMVWVGGSTLILNLTTLTLIVLVRRRHKRRMLDAVEKSYIHYD